MSSINCSNGSSNSSSIYDITQRIEEELTYIYEMRMKQFMDSSETEETVSGKNNQDKTNSLKDNKYFSMFAR